MQNQAPNLMLFCKDVERLLRQKTKVPTLSVSVSSDKDSTVLYVKLNMQEHNLELFKEMKIVAKEKDLKEIAKLANRNYYDLFEYTETVNIVPDENILDYLPELENAVQELLSQYQDVKNAFEEWLDADVETTTNLEQVEHQ